MKPMTYPLGDAVLYHGERGHELDGVHPEACLCGFDPYWRCEGWLSGEGTLGSLTISRTDDGQIVITP